jgi:hypothetical protein
MLQILEEEPEKFMIKMWRFLILTIESSKLGLLERK